MTSSREHAWGQAAGTADLFDGGIATPVAGERVPLSDGAWLLRGFALDVDAALMQAVDAIAHAAPFRHLTTPGGFRMSVAMTNCGRMGWVSDRRGYRYERLDPCSGQPWPKMPACFVALASRAAADAGYPGFDPDACLINRYVPGARLTLHQDRDEARLEAPIVSVSLGVPASFLWGGLDRRDSTQRHALAHGDVVVWGGASRMRFHGIAPLRQGWHPAAGDIRINLTFRCAG
ncbi:DNA oxidative demethylase AlkB [Aerolutibacter ruishenii]|uniref:Alkylated DNA repair protein (DNA oxidative demethylase) n=1 Tax=Aerolutibacter ruishenii TaxID=686800 RepID=A0A562LVD6_9GAMM|nr:DNA oxidative demethylase AlkB [Lysobacter ruishenii]TWI11619.1 alkylated DNA repair protein (DNA oxidative demethylase) [Lysobacter ruishenii]